MPWFCCDLLCFSDFTRTFTQIFIFNEYKLLLFILWFNHKKNHSVQICCCTFHMLYYLLTQQSTCMSLFVTMSSWSLVFTLQPFSCCSYCCLFFCPKCRQYKKAVPDDDYKGFGSMSWLDWCQWCTSVVKYGGQGQSAQAIKLFQVPRKISTLRI